MDNFKFMKSIGIFVCLIFCLNGCYYDSEDDVYPPTDCNTTSVSFINDIQPILANSCLSCHNTLSSIGGGIILEGHAAVLRYANDASLVGSVKHSSGYSAMPQSASKLDDCKISKIEAWVQAGSPNN
jgi:hypothetical protein